ncbi:hypothetical protein BSKO_00379 [Bryopsis sp. KO-2023]|nr:hypothetical protein BSKO_00379 [Bryopsis sp. KO-2023]
MSDPNAFITQLPVRGSTCTVLSRERNTFSRTVQKASFQMQSKAAQNVASNSFIREFHTCRPHGFPKSVSPARILVEPQRRSVSVGAKGTRAAKRYKYSSRATLEAHQPVFVSVKPDGSDSWRLDPIAELLRNGGVGIIPTDTLPAVVCDSGNKDAVEKLYEIKEMNPKKPLSILVGGFSHIGTYTLGFPASNEPGVRDTFTVAKQVLPGPYTFILPASKQLPKQCVDYESGKSKQRRSVGVRWANDPICQAILEMLERPLLCSSMHIEGQDGEAFELPDAMSLMEYYSLSGIDFMVDAGKRVAVESTIVDMTGRAPVVIREGPGDASAFL